MNAEEIQARKEECRREVLAYLYARQAVAQAAPTIRRGLAGEFDFDLPEVRGAAEFLVGLGLLKATPDPLGATTYYQITAAGILAHERN